MMNAMISVYQIVADHESESLVTLANECELKSIRLCKAVEQAQVESDTIELVCLVQRKLVYLFQFFGLCLITRHV